MSSKTIFLLISIIITLFTTISCSDLNSGNCLDLYHDKEMTSFFTQNTGGANCPDAQRFYDKLPEQNHSEDIDHLFIQSYIKSHYVTTYVTRQITNRHNKEREVVFSILIPIKAYISNFAIEIDGELNESKVNKRSQEHFDKTRFEQDGSKLRNFRLAIKLKPNSKATFHLLYEELIPLKNGSYELSLHIHPGEIIENLDVQVYINENQPLQFVKVPPLKDPTEPARNNSKLIPSITPVFKNKNSALIRFQPTPLQQKQFIEAHKMDVKKGLDEQFRVQYDVERNSNGVIFTHGKYFVHYFSPQNLPVLRKHVVFVLDISNSMVGKRLSQVKEAMQHILKQLKPDDIFNLATFHSSVFIDDIKNKKGFQSCLSYKFDKYANIEKALENVTLPEAVKATKENIDVAIKDVKNLVAKSNTFMLGAVEMGVLLVKRFHRPGKKYEPIIVFLTDGEPTVGVKSKRKILETVTTFNANFSSIYTLAIGDEIDFSFLEKLSQLNRGEAMFVKKDTDVSELLKNFFDGISRPVLNQIRFSYVTNSTQITNTQFITLFDGTELVVAGKADDLRTSPRVIGKTQDGENEYVPDFIHSPTRLDRLWAFLMLQQNMQFLVYGRPSNKLLKETLNLALEYSFVTPLTSFEISIPGGQTINDDELLTPIYKLMRNLHSISTTINGTQIHKQKFPFVLRRTKPMASGEH